ncbi:hypothetical protein ACCS79_03730 [Rhizobium johnstonii]|uniref:hypothetical protein n=1 Tax=Rhizobium johnstonii TaxID=3019933 RepID=UPI003F94C7F6
MTTHIKNASSSSQAARLNLLEEKVRNLVPDPDPDEPPDLTDVIALLNRIYGLTYEGGVVGAADPDHWDENVTYFENTSTGSTTLFRSIWGAVSGQNKFEQFAARPLFQQAFGNGSILFGGPDYSLTSVTYGPDQDYLDSIRGFSSEQNLVGCLFGGRNGFVAGMVTGKPLLARIIDLEAKLATETAERKAEDAALRALIIARTS